MSVDIHVHVYTYESIIIAGVYVCVRGHLHHRQTSAAAESSHLPEDGPNPTTPHSPDTP